MLPRLWRHTRQAAMTVGCESLADAPERCDGTALEGLAQRIDAIDHVGARFHRFTKVRAEVGDTVLGVGAFATELVVVKAATRAQATLSVNVGGCWGE